MSISDFFKKGIPKAKSAETLDSAFELRGVEVESSDYAEERAREKSRYIPDVDFTSASNFARYGAPILAALKNPLKALYHPFWLLILLMILAAAGLSGFRNIIGIVGLTLLLGIFYWGKMRSVFVSFSCAQSAVVYYSSLFLYRRKIPKKNKRYSPFVHHYYNNNFFFFFTVLNMY